jgi:NhaP-type Na+/H+ or K+/H+ antiporter
VDGKLFDNASLTIALALAVGLIAQAVAARLRLPGLVLLLVAGVLVGPDVANVIRPSLLEGSLHALVGFAVAVILFEGGLGLDIQRLRRERRAIRQLVTLGALVTAVAGTFAARITMGWSIRLCILFGTLIVVTGPTVVTPLLRRIKVTSTVGTILEAEGVLIDAIGAIVAAVALEIALHPSGTRLALGPLEIAGRLAAGAAIGAVGGLVIALPLRRPDVVPERLENVLTLAMVLTIYEVSGALLHESGLSAAVTAGIVVRNARVHVERELREFKEQLTVMLVGLLFILLAADVRLDDVRALGWSGVALTLVIIVVIRPLSVLVGTWGAGLGWRERLFIGWIGPRGIVAAAVASLFATELGAAGVEGGVELRAMVFLLIAASVLWSGLTGGAMASLLGLRRNREHGWLILGANGVGRTLARLLSGAGHDAVCIDSNPNAIRAAEAEGISVIYGNGLDTLTLQRGEVDTRIGTIALTGNDEVNFLFSQRARREARQLRLCIALESLGSGVTQAMVHGLGAEVLSGGGLDVDRWSKLIERNEASVRWFRWVGGSRDQPLVLEQQGNPPYVPLVVRRSGTVVPVSDATRFRKDDELGCLVHAGRAEVALERLGEAGFEVKS